VRNRIKCKNNLFWIVGPIINVSLSDIPLFVLADASNTNPSRATGVFDYRVVRHIRRYQALLLTTYALIPDIPPRLVFVSQRRIDIKFALQR